MPRYVVQMELFIYIRAEYHSTLDAHDGSEAVDAVLEDIEADVNYFDDWLATKKATIAELRRNNAEIISVREVEP